MDRQDNQHNVFQSFPNVLSFASPVHTPSQRRLFSNFTQPKPPIPAARRLAWVSLQGRLVNAEQASSVRSIRGGLGPDEAIAWQLFSPIERFLIVAVIGVAVSESKKNHQIGQLKRAVELRDQVLLSMQQKLEDLFNQVNLVEDQSETGKDMALRKNADLADPGVFGHDKIKCIDCGCWLCDQHLDLLGHLEGNAATKPSYGAEMMQYKMPLMNEAEPEERRMSDLSDWASSVTSAADIQISPIFYLFSSNDSEYYSLGNWALKNDDTAKKLDHSSVELQILKFVATPISVPEQSHIDGKTFRAKHMNTLSIEQDMIFLKKDCDEKGATIKELTNLLHSSEVSCSQRISELEDIIRRKNTIISKLKKDMVVLEQKVIQLTRLRRPSSCTSNSEMQPIPYMTDNLVYDMGSSTSPSSSDSDCSHSESSQPPPTRKHDSTHHIRNSEPCLTRATQKSGTKKRPSTSDSRTKPETGTRSNETWLNNRKAEVMWTPSPKQRGGEMVHGSGDSTHMRRRFQTGGKETAERKRNCSQHGFVVTHR